jgi:hypothetical protein
MHKSVESTNPSLVELLVSSVSLLMLGFCFSLLVFCL